MATARKKPATSKRTAAAAPAKGKRTGARKAAKAPARSVPKAAKARKAVAKPATPKRAKKAATPARASKGDAGIERIIVENVNVPGYKHGVDAAKYREMHAAMLKVMPRGPPGLTQDEMGKAVQAHVGPELKAKAMWWAKTVQLDLEAKKQLVRESTKPLRWHLAP